MAIQKNFVVKNGIEVNDNLIFGDTDSNKVGIATTNPRYTLHVNGGIGATTLSVIGVSTVNNLTINGRVSAGSSLGVAGQYLVSTGTGVTWGAVPTVRSTDLQTAGVGATTFNTTYSVGLLDVYVNGVKLSADEYTANNGATVVLDDACFGGETVEFISYSPFGIGIGGTAIQGITILEEGSPVGGALQVTSINFVGASVTATGSGIGVTVSLSDYVASSGIATYATTSGIATYSGTSEVSIVSQGLSGTPNIEVGIITSTNVIVGGATTQLIVTGDTRITGILTIGTSSITLDGSSNTINVGSGVTIDGTAGTISATSFIGDGSGLIGVVGSGSGVVVLDDGSTVGTAGTIDFGSNLSVSAISAGIVTVTVVGYATEGYVDNAVVGFITSGALSGYATAGYVDSNIQPSYWVSTAAGIHTLSNVGVGTTNPTSALTVGAVGSATTNFVVNGRAKIDGIDIRQSSDYSIFIGKECGELEYNLGANNGNIAIGYRALYDAFAPDYNIAIGNEALSHANNSNNNVVIGHQVGSNPSFAGDDNVFIGYEVGINATSSNRNTLIGYQAGYSLSTGDNNCFYGSFSGYDITTGSDNTIIGNFNGNENGLDIRTSSNNVVLSDGAGNIRFYANSSGRVGIGTTNPTSALTVTGSGTSTSQLYVTGVATCNGVLYAPDGINIGDTNVAGASRNIEFSNAFTKRIIFRTNQNADFFSFSDYYGGFDHYVFEISKTGDITSSGNLSISGIVTCTTTSSNGATFNSTAGEAYVVLNSGTNFTSFLDFKENGALKANICYAPNSSGALELNSASNKNIVIATGGGSVGIGTTNPTSKLTVRGGDISVGVSTAHGVILTSPNGTQYRLIVDDNGTLSTVAV